MWRYSARRSARSTSLGSPYFSTRLLMIFRVYIQVWFERRGVGVRKRDPLAFASAQHLLVYRGRCICFGRGNKASELDIVLQLSCLRAPPGDGRAIPQLNCNTALRSYLVWPLRRVSGFSSTQEIQQSRKWISTRPRTLWLFSSWWWPLKYAIE
jgi:hypothetical protein